MNENNQVNKKEKSKLNIIIAVGLGLIALTVALMPFFYISKAVVTGQ